MTRSVFYGFPAYVGALYGERTSGFWPSDPAALGWDATKLVPVDQANTPQAFRDGTITVAQITVDDHATNPNQPGLTQIGPMWPDGETIGACWLEQAYYDGLAAGIKPARVPAGMLCHDYELTSTIEWDPPPTPGGRRFYGVHASVISVLGPLSLTTIWHPGTSLVPGVAPAGTLWIDLSLVALPVGAFTKIGPGVSTGALFIDRTTAVSLALRGPKLPLGTGFDFLP